MFKSFGTILLIWFLSELFAQSFKAADSAFSASFKTLESAAIFSQEKLKE